MLSSTRSTYVPEHLLGRAVGVVVFEPTPNCPRCGDPLVELSTPIVLRDTFSHLTTSHHCTHCPIVVVDGSQLPGRNVAAVIGFMLADSTIYPFQDVHYLAS
ncbi:MAG: hypothetical protein ACYCW6_29940 [Candidatus Xenobia bacterium]